MFGGGTAGVGIADHIRGQMARDGLTADQATRQIWIVDLPGLLTGDMGDGLLDYQRPHARPAPRPRLGHHAGPGRPVHPPCAGRRRPRCARPGPLRASSPWTP